MYLYHRGDNSTDEYEDYYSSTESYSNIVRAFKMYGQIADYTKEYDKTLADVFCYSVYSKGENYVVKLNIDYLKHHTAVAFPTVIMLKDNEVAAGKKEA